MKRIDMPTPNGSSPRRSRDAGLISEVMSAFREGRAVLTDPDDDLPSMSAIRQHFDTRVNSYLHSELGPGTFKLHWKRDAGGGSVWWISKEVDREAPLE